MRSRTSSFSRPTRRWGGWSVRASRRSSASPGEGSSGVSAAGGSGTSPRPARSGSGWTASTTPNCTGRIPRARPWSARTDRGHGLLREVNRRLVALGAGQAKAETATIDLDTTIIGSGKRDCHYTYRAGNRTVPGERGYQPLVAYVGELDMAPWLEMRDRNVPASFENRRGLEATLRQLPESIRRATLRTDGTGYQEEVFRFCNDPAGRPADLRRFGVIGLFCGATRSEELMAEAKRLPEAAWRPLHKPGSGDGSKPGDDGDIIECAELPFVSNMTARAKPGHVIRYVATRRLVPDQFPVDAGQLPSRNGSNWEIRAYATNHLAPDAIPSDKANGLSVMTGPEVVRQAHLRCGRGEEIHSILKSDLAGGIMPSGRFGANAAWMLLTALSRNVVAATNLAADGLESPRRIRLKRLRARWLHIAARLVSSGRRFRLIFGESGRHIVKTVARIRHNIEKLLATQPHPPPRTAG